MVCSSIPPNEVLGFFSIKSYVVIGFVVPTASPLMVRFESCNGASNFFFRVNFLSFINPAALYLLLYIFICCFKSQVTISNSLFFLRILLYWCFITLPFFYDVIHRPYIWESYIFLILLPSIYHPSFYPHPFSFASQPRIRFLL